MSDDLRTRIAAAIKARWRDMSMEETWDEGALLLADAVIREVLTPEFLADMMIAAVKKAADDE